MNSMIEAVARALCRLCEQRDLDVCVQEKTIDNYWRDFIPESCTVIRAMIERLMTTGEPEDHAAAQVLCKALEEQNNG